MRARDRHRGAGFTLIELVVVLVIMGVVVALATPSLESVLRRSPAEKAIDTTVETLRAARLRAVSSGDPQRVSIEPDGGGLVGPGGRLRFEGGVLAEPLSGSAEIVFFPTGLASGGAWRLRAPGGNAALVEVAALTGAIRTRSGEVSS